MDFKQPILVTGATGFVGRHVVEVLREAGWRVRRALRRPSASAGEDVEDVVVGELGLDTDWGRALADVGSVVHLAARVHRLRDGSPDPLADFRRVNVEATEALARAALAHGVPRFLFMSSVKVNGERTKRLPDGSLERFSAAFAPAPEDAYGLSKCEAERCLARLAGEGLRLTVLRPPLVYGPGVGANFGRLMALAHRRLPLPLAAVYNLRSFIYVRNLADAVRACLSNPKAEGRTYLVSDLDISTFDLMHHLGKAMGRPQRLWPFPLAMLRALGTLTGRGAEVGRPLDSLLVDSEPMRRELGWTPPVEPEAGLRATAEWYLSTRS